MSDRTPFATFDRLVRAPTLRTARDRHSSGAAAKLGMRRISLQFKIQKLGITRPHQ